MIISNIESPIHIDELVRRCSQIWKYRIPDSRIMERVLQAKRYAINKKMLTQKGMFLWLPEMDTPPIRNRSAQGAPKNIEMIAPEEIVLLTQKVKEINVGIEKEELIKEVAYHLGIERVTIEVSEYIQKCLPEKPDVKD